MLGENEQHWFHFVRSRCHKTHALFSSESVNNWLLVCVQKDIAEIYGKHEACFMYNARVIEDNCGMKDNL